MRGRPRKFNETKVLTDAMLVFWEKGLSATSLDDLVAATGLNRPSIYNAFGNKEDIYRKALALFCEQLHEAIESIIEDQRDIRTSLVVFFDQAISVYCSSNPAMGCLAVCTAPSEAHSYPEVGNDLKQLIAQIDAGFVKRLDRAKVEEEFLADIEVDGAAKMLQAILQTIALRARTGTTKKELTDFARYAVKNILA